MSIPILCFHCSTHIADTDVARLDWSLHGEMFTAIYPGWTLRPGMLDLNIWCPVCSMFPFHHDPYTAGGNAVGKNLKVKGADGKPVILTVKQIIMGYTPIAEAQKAFAKEVMTTILPPPSKPQPVIHEYTNTPMEKGSKQAPQGFKPDGREDFKAPVDLAPDDPRLKNMEAILKSGPDRGDGPVTEEEVNQLMSERGDKAPLIERVTGGDPELRPGEGFAPEEATR